MHTEDEAINEKLCPAAMGSGATERSIMKAGREVDALIEEKVMGHGSRWNFMPSTNIADAWSVVEQLKVSKWEFFAVGRSDNRLGLWFCELGKQFQLSNSEVIAYADTAPLAICLASLKAMEHKEKLAKPETVW